MASTKTKYYSEEEGHTGNVIGLPNGECTLIGPKYHLIPEGRYQAKFLHHETSNIFTRKKGNARIGGKLYLWFEILPFHPVEISGVRLFKSYNVSSLVGKPGRNGKFNMTRGKWFVRDYERLLGSTKRHDRLSPHAFAGKIYQIKVNTVAVDQNKQEWCEASKYSVIGRIEEVLAGV